MAPEFDISGLHVLISDTGDAYHTYHHTRPPREPSWTSAGANVGLFCRVYLVAEVGVIELSNRPGFIQSGQIRVRHCLSIRASSQSDEYVH